MKLFGKDFTKEEIRQRIGDVSQIAGIKFYSFNDGPGKGTDAMDIKTGSGFCFTVLPGRSMDIAWMEHSGRAISYITKAGVKNSSFYNPQGFEWLRSFFGGALTTCGLTHVGPPEKSGIWDLGLHGRIANTPAEEVSYKTEWEGNELVFKIEGKVREAVLYEENLVLTRKIVTRAGENKLLICDEIENQGYQETPFMLLYHINLGFPLVSDDSRLIAPVTGTEARDEASLRGLDSYGCFESPIPGCETQVFFHSLAADESLNTCAGIINEEMEFGFYIKYNKNELPFLSQWKNMAQQDYVVGIEPGNCTPIGRSAAREKGELQYLKPGEKRTVKLEMCVLTNRKEIDEYKLYVNKLLI